MELHLQVSALLLCAFIISGVFGQIEAEGKNRTYEFGFDIGSQHRQEMKDERGIITGEYGFVSADGYYRSVQYATDEQGRFIILSRKRVRVTPPKPALDQSASSAVDPSSNNETDGQKRPQGTGIGAEDPSRPKEPPTTTTTTTTTTERVKIYQFNYTALHTPDTRKHGHQEMGFSDSSKMGDYYWDGPDGYRRIITYNADDKGGYVPVLRQIEIPKEVDV